MRATVAVAALIDHKGPIGNFNLIGAHVVDHLGPVQRRRQATLGHSAHIHRAHAGCGRVQDHEFGFGFFGQFHRLAQHRFAIGLLQRALANDDHRIHVLDRAEFFACQLGQRRAIRADMGIFICQINGFADQPDVRTTRPRAADAGIQHGCFLTRIGADQLDHLGVIDVCNRRCADIGRAVAFRQFGAIGAAFDIAALSFDQLFQGKSGLYRRQVAHKTCNLLALHRLGDFGQSLWPCGRAQFAIFADIGLVQPLATQAVPDEARLVGNPFLIHAVMVARQDPHHFAPFCVHPDIGAKRIHHIDGFGLGQLPGPRVERIRLGHQRTHGAQVNDIALQIAVERLVQIAGDLGILTPTCLAHLSDAGHLGCKAHTACARDAARHVGFHKWSQIQIFAGAFWFAVAREINAVSHRLILQVTLTTLIADRAIQRVVDQQKLHYAFSGLFDHRRIGFHNRRLALGTRAQVADLHRT